jgi:hypothetical protein
VYAIRSILEEPTTIIFGTFVDCCILKENLCLKNVEK